MKRLLMACVVFAALAFPVAARAALPTQGIFTTCVASTNCNSKMDDMQSAGLGVGVFFNALYGHLTDLDTLLTHADADAFDVFISIQQAPQNATDALTGTSLVDAFSSGGMTGDCSATTNQQFITCVISHCDAHVHCKGWYITDEPGCPDVTDFGYCRGSMYGQSSCGGVSSTCRYQNVDELATWLQSNDPTKSVVGYNTPSGIPACSGGWSGTCAQGQLDNLYSCNGHAPCNGVYCWLSCTNILHMGYDYYPVGNPFQPSQSISDVTTIGTLLQNTLNSNCATCHNAYIAQAFSYTQGGYSSCTDIGACPYPTSAQMISMRNNGILAAAAAGHPLEYVWYYSYEDAKCIHGYAGSPPNPTCDATTNWNILKAAVAAADPVGGGTCCWLLACRNKCKPTPVPKPTRRPEGSGPAVTLVPGAWPWQGRWLEAAEGSTLSRQATQEGAT